MLCNIQKAAISKEKWGSSALLWDPAATYLSAQCGKVARRCCGSSCLVLPAFCSSASLYPPLAALSSAESSAKALCAMAGDMARKERLLQGITKRNTLLCRVFLFCGIRQLPIFPANAPTVRKGRVALPQGGCLTLPCSLGCRLAASPTGRARLCPITSR